jgi:uncharacterized membrane protein
MRARLPWILLAVSVVLNLCFIAGAVWVRMHGPPPRFAAADPALRVENMSKELALSDNQRAALETMFRRDQARRGEAVVEGVTKDVGLGPDQHAAFERFIRTARMETRHLREKNQPLFEEGLRELGKPDPDQAVLDRLFTEAAANRRNYQIELSHSLRTFLVTLKPEQRQKFLAILRNRQNAPPVMRQILQ